MDASKEPLTSGDAGLLIERTSTADQVSQLLRARILRGELQPGTPLRELHLAESMGVSRNTVREGIRALVSESLVKHHVHKGVVVASLSEGDVADLYATRRVIEIAAVNGATKATPERLHALKDQAERVDVSARDGLFGSLVDADFAFHASIVSFLGVERISSFFRSILSELKLGLFLLDKEDSYPAQEWSADHVEVSELLAAGKRRDAARALSRHLTTSEFELIKVVRARDL